MLEYGAKMNHRVAKFIIVHDDLDEVIIKDIGEWDTTPTITNTADEVVKELAPILAGRRLLYIDSDGKTDQLLIKDGKFDGFLSLDTEERR